MIKTYISASQNSPIIELLFLIARYQDNKDIPNVKRKLIIIAR